jgi:cell division protein FtsB
VSTRATAVRARPRLRFTPRAAILAVLVVALLFYLLVPLRTYMEQRTRLDQLSDRVELLQKQNAELESRIEHYKDPSYLESLARDCLGMVKPGEIPFLIVPKGGTPPPPRCP